jgi:Gcd10p family
MQAYFTSSAAKVYHLRPDTLATMLHLANIGPSSRVLCIDSCFGLIATACAERMGGQGTLCCAHLEAQRYKLDTVRLLNQPAWHAQNARQTRIGDLLAAAGTPASKADTTDAAHGAAPDRHGASAASVPHVDAPQSANGVDDNGATNADSAQPGATNAEARQALLLHQPPPAGVKLPDAIMPAQEADLAVIARDGFSSMCLAAPRLDYAALVPQLLPLLLPCATFCIYAPALQPLTECFHALQQTKCCIGLQVRLFPSPQSEPCLWLLIQLCI